MALVAPPAALGQVVAWKIECTGARQPGLRRLGAKAQGLEQFAAVEPVRERVTPCQLRRGRYVRAEDQQQAARRLGLTLGECVALGQWFVQQRWWQRPDKVGAIRAQQHAHARGADHPAYAQRVDACERAHAGIRAHQCQHPPDILAQHAVRSRADRLAPGDAGALLPWRRDAGAGEAFEQQAIAVSKVQHERARIRRGDAEHRQRPVAAHLVDAAQRLQQPRGGRVIGAREPGGQRSSDVGARHRRTIAIAQMRTQHEREREAVGRPLPVIRQARPHDASGIALDQAAREQALDRSAQRIGRPIGTERGRAVAGGPSGAHARLRRGLARAGAGQAQQQDGSANGGAAVSLPSEGDHARDIRASGAALHPSAHLRSPFTNRAC